MSGLRALRQLLYGGARGLGWLIALLAWRLPARLANALIGRGIGRLWR